jgi:uncharacterized protein YecA (UPF0149 family)
MKQKELFDLAEKAGLGFIRHASEKDIEKFEELVRLVAHETLEEVAKDFESMRIAFGDTAASFAQYVREMKS